MTAGEEKPPTFIMRWDRGREISFEGRYSRQGVKQPFGYTGYRYDFVGDTYFAQAREYQPAYGRFLAEDIRRGRTAILKTRNCYGYCWNNPVGMVDLNGMEPELPGEKIWFQKAPSPEENLDAIVSGLMEPKKEKKSSSSFVDLEEIWSTIQATPMPEAAPLEEDYGGGITAKIREVTKDWNGVLVGSVTYNLGVIERVSGGFQVANDWHGNHAIYHVEGTGVQLGASSNLSFEVGWLKGSSIKSAEGFSVDVGGSLGLGYVGGVSIIFGENDSGKLEFSGVMVEIGSGAALEGHVSMSNATKIVEWNWFDLLDKFEFFLQDLFDGKTNTELCKN